MNNYISFGIGLVVGAAAGAGIVYCIMKDNKKAEPDKVTVSTEDKAAISTSAEELTEYYLQQLRELGVVSVYDEEEYIEEINNQAQPPYPDVVRRSSVNPIEDDDEEPEEEEESNFVPVEPNPNPYEIPDREFGTKDFYECPTLSWYQGDHVMCDEDYDTLDDWKAMVGDIEDKLMDAKDNIYIRNEVQQCDYEILIYDTSYKSAVEGEEELGDMAD